MRIKNLLIVCGIVLTALLAANVVPVKAEASPPLIGTATSTVTIFEHDAFNPEMTVTLGTPLPGTVSGARFPLPMNWEQNPALVTSWKLWNAPGDCGIAAVTTGAGGTGPTFTPGNFRCRYGTADVAHSAWTIELEPLTSGGIMEPAPLNVTFSANAFQAPMTGTSSTWAQILLRDDGSSGLTPLYNLTFNLVDIAITPPIQNVSCTTGGYIQTEALTMTGLPSVDLQGNSITPEFALLTDPPNGITFNPTTGVLSGMSTETPGPETLQIGVGTPEVATKTTAQIKVNTPDPLPNTGIDISQPAQLSFLFLSAGLALVLTSIVRPRRATRNRRTR